LNRGLVNDNFRSLVAFEVDRTRDLFKKGLKLADLVEGSVRLDITLFSRGGLAVLDAIAKQNYDVLSRRPSLTRRHKGWLFLSTWAQIRLRRGVKGLAR